MLPRFNIVRQRTAALDTVLLNLSWGTLVLGFTISRKPLEIDFEDELYPHQRARNTVAIIFMVLLHVIIAYLLLTKKVNPPVKKGEEGQLVFLDLKSKTESEKPEVPKRQPKKPQAPRPVTITAPSKPTVESIQSISPVAAPPVVDTMSRIAEARERRRALEAEAAQLNREAETASNGPSENDLAMARIKANIQAANYNRKGTGGVFQILSKGVQTGRFLFRGWTNDPHENTRQTYEVDAGIGGDVKLAIIRRMIQLIRERFTGDFTWVSDRLGRDIVLSARPKDNAELEAFMMKEFPD